MGQTKEIVIKIIPAKTANRFVKENHYSGKYAVSSTVHFGCFLNGVLHGVMSFGNPIDRRKLINLVVDNNNNPVLWTEFLELNRMAFDDTLPKNSESRCFAIAVKLIKKNAPHIKWIISFSDATQCGDGAIYRASGFLLTAIRASKFDLWRTPESIGLNGEVAHRIAIQGGSIGRISRILLSKYGTKNVSIKRLVQDFGGEALTGYQLRYIYLIDKTLKINCPIIPFSEILKVGAGMYRGVSKPACEAFTDDATGKPAREGVRFDPHAPKNDVTEAKQRG